MLDLEPPILVDLVALVDVDGTPCITLETRVEEA